MIRNINHCGRSLTLFIFLCCIINTRLTAQQILNLDFEKTSIEGISRPWGWDLATYASTTAVMDSTVKKNGNYSLKMEASSNTGEQVMGSYFEEYELKNKTVVLEGWIRTYELKGTASFFLSYMAKGDTAETVIRARPVTNSTEWIKLSITAKLPVNTISINAGIRHEGTGIAWFDDFSLLVNGKKKEQLEIAPPFSTKQIQWLNDNTTSIKTVDAAQFGTTPYEEDLSFFKSLVGDARIIALGESTHGTSEFFRLKHRVLEYAVNNMGVRVFAIEDHPLVVARANQYVMGGPGTARAAMGGMLGVWQTKEVHDMIDWMRHYNDAHPTDKVIFTGFDIQNHSIAIDSLYSFLKERSPELNQQVKALLDDLRKNGHNSYSVSDSVKLAWFNNAKQVLDMVTTTCNNWLLTIKNPAESLAINWGIQYATLIKQFAENTYKGHTSLYRDIAMAENVSWIINVYKPGARVLLWAHDVHISRGDHPNNDMNIYYGKSMGSHLARKYGADYKSFGLFTYQGEYSCYVSYSNFKVTDCPVYN
ncbi:MAG TPA: erythromycin esterase family protein, partial [Chitinophagaceae bacterium]|nr:erythromycin esterase family protein [Chitinophagaceae bacterium]